MKVALVMEWLDAWRGGAEASTQQFIDHLVDSGVEVHVFTRSRPSPRPGLQVHTISGAAMSRTRRSMTFALRVEPLLEHGAFDVVHAISPFRGADLYQPRGGTAAETIERNLALRPRGVVRTLKRHANRFNLKQRYLLAMERTLMQRDAGPVIVAISNYVVEQLKKHYSLPPERIRLIYNGVNGDPSPPPLRAENRRTIREAYGVADDAFLVILVAHNFRLKGVARWMEALSLLLRRGVTNIRSIVLGKGDAPPWHRLAERLSIENHCFFAGPTDRMPTFHHAADVLVHPTYYDPCSRAVLEGMVNGLPCITTRWDGASELIEDGCNGFVLDDPDDVETLADRVHLLQDEHRRRKMGQAARLVADRASMARHAREMTELYESIAQMRTVPSCP